MSGLDDILDDVFVRPLKEKAAKERAEAAAKQAEVDRVAADAASKVRADEHAALAAERKELQRKLAAAEHKARVQKIEAAELEIKADRERRGKDAHGPKKLRRRAVRLLEDRERGSS